MKKPLKSDAHIRAGKIRHVTGQITTVPLDLLPAYLALNGLSPAPIRNTSGVLIVRKESDGRRNQPQN